MDKSVHAETKEIVINCNNCNDITERHYCAKCVKQHKFNVIIICFCAITIVVNAVLVANVISNSNKQKYLQDSINLLQRQISDLTGQIVEESNFVAEDGKHSTIQNIPSSNKYKSNKYNERLKRKAAKTTRSKRNKTETKKREYVHIEGSGGQHTPEDRFAGVFHKWQLANWTQPKVKGKKENGIIQTGKDEFNLNLLNGELTIKTGGIYFVYSQVTLIGLTNQGYYVERKRGQSEDKIASCNLHMKSSSQKVDVEYNQYFTCNTMGIYEFSNGDKIRLRHFNNVGVMALFDSNASYFGLIKLK